MADILKQSTGPGSGGVENWGSGETFVEGTAQRPITNLVENDIAINNHLIEISNFLKDGVIQGQGTDFTVTLVQNNDPEMTYQIDTGTG